jgi:hypothetical protein
MAHQLIVAEIKNEGCEISKFRYVGVLVTEEGHKKACVVQSLVELNNRLGVSLYHGAWADIENGLATKGAWQGSITLSGTTWMEFASVY